MKKSLWFGPAYQSPGIHLSARITPCAELSVTVGGESRDLTVVLGLGWLHLRLETENLFPRSWRTRVSSWADAQAEHLNATRSMEEFSPVYAYELDPMNHGRTTGFYAFEGTISIQLWNSSMGWSCRDRSVAPWNGNGWTWRISIVDLLLGESEYEREDEEATYAEERDVILPEGRYPATVTSYRCRWNRRWWKGDWVGRTEVDVPGGVPIPGKGENSHDIDDDAVYGLTTTGGGMDGVWALTESVLRDRYRRASLNWVPNEGWPAHCQS